MSIVFWAGILLTVLTSSAFGQNMFRKVTDFDGDGKTDYAVTRNENGLKVWYVWQSTAGFKAFQWGLNADSSVAADYDGDNKTDFAVYRLESSSQLVVFYINNSQTNSFSYWGTFRHNFNQPMQQDYDGDGKVDPASWASDGSGGGVGIRQSTTNSNNGYSIPFGSFTARVGDTGGDGKADAMSYVAGNGNIVKITDSATNETRTVQFGLGNDLFFPADFDGDGKGDLSIWRVSDGTWWWIRSSDNVVNATTWGVSGDRAVPGDYDGDGKTDVAIYRSGTPDSPQSYYWVYGSSTGVAVFPWGSMNDSVVTF